MLLQAASKKSPQATLSLRVMATLRSAIAEKTGVDQEAPVRPNSACDLAKKSPAEFRALIAIEGGIIYGDSLDPWQKDDCDAMDGAWMYAAGVSGVKPTVRRFYLERPRGHSKTTDIAAYCIWAVLAAPQRKEGVVGASSEDQARILISAASRLLSFNTWLSEEVEVTSKSIRNKITGTEITVVAQNAGAAYGKLADFIVADELTVWTKRDLWDAIYSGMPKVKTAVAVIISNAGYGMGSSWQWGVRQTAATSKDWYFHSLDGIQASWVSEEDVKINSESLDDSEVRRLYYNEWLKDRAGGIPVSQIENATLLAGPAVGPNKKYVSIVAGLDIGLVHDRTSLVVLGVDLAGARLDLLEHRTWRPSDYPSGRISLEDIETMIIMLHQRLGGISAVLADRWEAARTVELLNKYGITCSEVSFASTELIRQLGSSFVGAFRDGTIRLYEDDVLERDIRAITVNFNDHTRLYKLTAERNADGHADSGFALAIAIYCGMEQLKFFMKGATAEREQMPSLPERLNVSE